MKRLPVFLAVSLVTNVLLAAVWWTAQPPAPNTPTSADTAAIDSTDRATGSPQGSAAASTAPTDDLTPALWQELAGDLTDTPADDATLVARLRAAHFSSAMIRSILRARIDARYTDREAALISAEPPSEFWRSRYTSPYSHDAATRQALRQISKEKKQQLAELLGDDAESVHERAYRQSRYGSLSAEKVDGLQAILDDYRDLQAELRQRSGPMPSASDREQLALLATERDRDLAALLTPEELKDYQQRESDTARRLRSQLNEFKPTESEYRALYELQSAFDAQWSASTAGLDREQRAARAEAQKQLDAEIAARLGAERYETYKLTSDSNYRYTKQLTDYLSLPPENATAVYQLRTEINAARTAIQSNRALSSAERLAQLSELQQRFRTSAEPLLTADGLAAYEGSFMGRWVQFLVPQPPPGGR